MPKTMISGRSAAIFLGPSAASVYALCDAGAAFEHNRKQDVDEVITYCTVEPVPGAKTGTIKGKLFFQRVTGAVVSITLSAPGSGFTSTPSVALSSGGGTGAAAVAVVDLNTGKVIALFVTANGSGYTSAPTVAVTSGGGTGCTGVAVINSYNTNWMDPLFNGDYSVGGLIYAEIRMDGTLTGKPTLAGYFVPGSFNAKFPNDKGPAMVEFDGVTNGWWLDTAQP